MPLKQSPLIRRAAALGSDVELRIVRNEGWVMAPHWHDRTQVIATIDGEGEALVGCHPPVPIPRATIVAIPPGAPHTAYAKGCKQWCFYSLHLRTTFENEPDIAPAAAARVFAADDMASIRLFELTEALAAKQIGRASDCLSALRMILQTPRNGSGSGTRWDLVALELCDPALAKEPLALVAARHGMSEGHLSRGFKRHFGIAPGSWRLNGRLERALRHVREGAEMREVCSLAGFRDPSHLARVCKRLTGLTPRQFRRGESSS